MLWGSMRVALSPSLFAVGRRNLHTHIKRLRQRIERDPTSPEHLVTIRGFGYRFSRPRRPGPPS
jgi:DNA-binding response OmpR family regulator